MSFGGGMFEGALAGAQQATQDWNGLTQAAGEGKLLLEPGVAEQCAKHCEDMIDKLDGHRADVGSLMWGVNMGVCQIGEQLSGKFSNKGVTDPKNSVVAVINEHQMVLKQMAAAYRAAGKAFASQEHDNTAAVRG